MTPSRPNRWLWAALLALAPVLVACGGAEARKAEHTEKGQKFLAERNYEKARVEFRNALQIDPKDGNLRALVGYTNEKLDEHKDAVAAYQLALEVDETLEMPRARLALIYASAGLTDEAMEYIEPGLQRKPDSSGLLTARAVATAQKDLASARHDAEKAVKLDPTNEDAVAVLSSLMWRVGERDQAIALLQQSVAKLPSSMNLRTALAQLLIAEGRIADGERNLVEIEKLDPNEIKHSFRLAQAYLLQGKVDPALSTLRAAADRHRDNVDAKLAVAQLLVQHRGYAAGEKQMQDYVAADRKNLDLQLGLGRFYEATGRADDAAKVYRSVIADAGSRQQGTVARNRLATLALAEGRLDEASSLVGEVLTANPRENAALATRAEIAMQRGDTGAAIADLRSALGDDPDSVPLSAALARAYMRAGSPDLAEQALRSAVQYRPKDVEARAELAAFLIQNGRPAQAQPVFEQLLEENPNDVPAMVALTRVQLANGDHAAALRTAKRLQAVEPQSPMGFQLAGTAHEAARNFDEARAAYQRASELNPAAADPILGLARLDHQQNSTVQALERLEQAAKALPQNPQVRAMKGDLLLLSGRAAEAVHSYQAAIGVAPQWGPGYQSLARAHEAAGAPERAVAALNQGYEATNGDPAVGLALALLHERQGQIAEAVQTYERMLQRMPGDQTAANNLAYLLAEKRQDRASLQRALELARRFENSASAPLLDTYGWVLYRTGQYRDAVNVLSRARQKAPDAPPVLFHLGMAQLKAGDTEDGRRNLQGAIEKRPNAAWATEAREALAAL